MNFEGIVAAQAAGFAESLAVGALLGAVYDMARVCRLAFRPGRRALFAVDMAFMLAAAFVTFAFLMKTANGQLRFFLLLGQGVGFAAWYCTVGRAVEAVFAAVFGAVRRMLGALWRPVSRVLGKGAKNTVKKLKRIKIKFKKLEYTTISLLQKHSLIVYNLLYLRMRRPVPAGHRRIYKGRCAVESEAEGEKELDSPSGAYGVRGVSGVLTYKLSGGDKPKARDTR